MAWRANLADLFELVADAVPERLALAHGTDGPTRTFAELEARANALAHHLLRSCAPGDKVAIFRIPGSWEQEGFKLLAKYGVEYCDRSVSMYEAAGRAVAKAKGA